MTLFNLFAASASIPNYGSAIFILSLQTFKTNLPKMWLGVSDSVTVGEPIIFKNC
jgi:hypothetical protein